MEITAFYEDGDVLSVISKRRVGLNPALRRVADYVLSHPFECKNMAIKELANNCVVAESTVTRFVKELNIGGFQRLKILIAEALTKSDNAPAFSAESNIFDNITADDSSEAMAQKVCVRSIEALNQTRLQLNLADVDRAAQLIDKANMIYFCSLGSSRLAAEEAVLRFTRVGKKVALLSSEVFQLLTSCVIGEGDLMIGISNSGRTASVVESLAVAKKNGATTLSITAFKNSPITRNSDLSIFTANVKEDQDIFSWESPFAKISQIYVIDLIYAKYASLNYKRSIKTLEETYNAIKHTRTR